MRSSSSSSRTTADPMDTGRRLIERIVVLIVVLMLILSLVVTSLPSPVLG